MAAVYAAREGSPPVAPPTQHMMVLAALRAARERRQGHAHAKTHALAVEWLKRLGSHLPGAESSRTATDQQCSRAGTTPLGDRAQDQSRYPHPGGFAGLRSARQRHRYLSPAWPLPWRTLERAIADRRAGLPLAPLPR